MIRINLLPIKQDRRREAGRNQVLIGVIVLVLECMVFWAFHMNAEAKVEQQKNQNQIIKADVNRIKKQIKDHTTILKEIEEFEKRQSAIEGLQDARTGPVHVMLELSNILSKNGRPLIDKARYQEKIQIDPASGYDEEWDYRRLWLTDFSEEEKKITIQGQAMTHEDVAELLRRINLSQFFVATELVSTDLASAQFPDKTKVERNVQPVVRFEVTGEIRYR